MSLTFEPLIPPGVWLTLAAALSAALAAYAWRRPWGVSRGTWGGIVGLMSTGAAMILGILLNPRWQERIPPPAGKPRLTVLIDESASMNVKDMPGGKTRFESAAAAAHACAEQLNGEYEVETAVFSKAVLATSTEELAKRVPGGTTTDLAAAITASVRADQPAGQAVLLFSDGHDNSAGGMSALQSAAALARASDAPVFTRTFGTTTEIDDIALRLSPPQQVAYLKKNVPLIAAVRRRGRAPESVTVIAELNGQEVGRQTAAVPPGEEQEIRFQVAQPQKGLFRYDVRVDAFDGEVTQANNRGTFLLRVVDEPIRVLLVEGKPYWDSKFLARTLSSDQSIELVSVVRMASERFLERTIRRVSPMGETPADGASSNDWRIIPDGARMLADAKSLGRFQIVVLGRDSDAFLTDESLAGLRRWISEDGGVLVCFRGQPMAQVNERLERLLPVKWKESQESRFRVALTDRGKALRWLDLAAVENSDQALEQLPSLATSSSPAQLKPLATVLATAAGDAAPALSYQPYGGGRVVVIEGAGMWRWAFLAPTNADHDATYPALWQSLLRWLVSSSGLLPGQDMALRVDQVTFDADEPASATLLVRRDAAIGTPPHIELTGGGLIQPRLVAPAPAGEGPGVFRVNFGALPEGRYEAQIAGRPKESAGAKAAFDVRKRMDEQLDVDARPELMARLAELTGGQVMTGDQTGDVAAAIRAHRDRGHPEQIRRSSAWDRWWVLAATIGVWALAWGVRRSAGLI